MAKFWQLGRELAVTMVWVVIALIIAVAILSFLSTQFSGNAVGTAANWTGEHLEFQG